MALPPLWGFHSAHRLPYAVFRLLPLAMRAGKPHATAMLTDRLAALGLSIPPVPGPFGAYVPARRAGNLVFVAGQLPMKDGKLMATGQVPSRCTVDAARAAARQCVVNALAAVQSAGIELDEIVGVVRVGAFVNSDTTFTQQPQVADGASEFLIELFGDAGRHARAAVGVNTLPRDASVEVEFVFEVSGGMP
jgi:enamine deaminase RidA (YjgF/YER057c/UK114 family)